MRESFICGFKLFLKEIECKNKKMQYLMLLNIWTLIVSKQIHRAEYASIHM